MSESSNDVVDSILNEIQEQADAPAAEEGEAVEVSTEEPQEADEDQQGDVNDEQEDDNRSKVIPRDRFDKVNSQKNELKQRLESLEAQLAEKDALNAKLQDDFRNMFSEKKEDQPEEDWIDPDAKKAFTEVDKKTEKLEKELESIKAAEQNKQTQAFKNAMEHVRAEAAKSDPDADQKLGYAVAHDAQELMNMGLPKQEAEQEAVRRYNAMAYSMLSQGKDPVQYAIQKAERLYPDQFKKANAEKQPNVDVAELDRLKKEAGAPTNKVASSDPEGDALESLAASIKKEKLQSNNW